MAKEISPKTRAPMLDLGDGQLVALKPGSRGQSQAQSPTVDMCFVFDTTGSMTDKIDGLIRCMQGMVDDLAQVGLDWRLTVLPFGDLTIPGDRIVTDRPFVTDVQSAKRELASMPRFSGGANQGESSIEAMLAACRKKYREDAAKLVVLLTDEPALCGSQTKPEHVDQALSALDAACFTVAPDRHYYRGWAHEHAGEWQRITAAADTSSILRMLRSLLARVVAVADSVQQIGGGSVRAYLSRSTGQ